MDVREIKSEGQGKGGEKRAAMVLLPLKIQRKEEKGIGFFLKNNSS